MNASLLVLAAALALSGCGRVVVAAVGARLVEPASLATGEAQVIDLRPEAEYEAGHVPGASNVPVLGLDGYLSRAGARPGRPLVLVCAHGVNAALSVPTARLHAGGEVLVLAGGMEGWRRAGRDVAEGPSPPLGADTSIPSRTFTWTQQLVACVSGCVLKPLYLLLAFLLLRLLGRASATPLRLLWHGLLWFFAGEVLCAANFYFHRPGLWFPIEILHGLGMVVMSALIPWGLWRLLDERVLRFEDPGHGCALQRLCGSCWKRDPVRCGLHDLMIPLVIGLAALALMPLTAPLRPTMFRTEVFGSSADYGEPILNHLVELRLYPVLGAVLFLATLPLLRGGQGSVRRAEPVFYAALGFTLYPVLRHLLSNAFRESLYWSDFWEELTELLMICVVAVLVLLFRRQLGLARGREAAPPPAQASAG